MTMKQTMLTRKDSDVGVGVFDSIAWAFECHVRTADRGEYKSAVLFGNEDCPERIDFYTQARPKVTDAPGYRWLRDTSNSDLAA